MSPRTRTSTAPVLRLPETRRSTLANGLELVLASRPRLPLAVARLELWSGSADDPPGREGLADFVGQVLRRGTRRRGAEAIDAAIERVGGSLGVDIDQDSTAIVATVPSEHLDVALQVMAELATQAAFPEREVALARRRTLASLANEVDDPSTVADLATSRKLLGDHPYAHAVGGRTPSVKTFTRALAVAHYRSTYVPQHAHLYVVGAFEAKQVERRVEREFAGWKATTGEAAGLPSLASVSGKRVILVDKPDATQTQLRFARIGMARNDPRHTTGSVAASILGGGFTSRLMEELRVRRGLTYGVSARFYAYRAGGEFAVSTFTANEKVELCVGETLRVCRQLAARGPTPEEMTRTATYLSGLFPLQLETNEQIARLLGDLALHGISHEHVSNFSERVHAVRASDVKEVARDFFPADDYLLLAVGPAASVRKQLASFGKVAVLPLSGVL